MIQEEGVPQGSVLSVTLFALAINGISKIVPKDIMHTLFVDDLSISFSASRMTAAERKLQICLDRVVKWTETRGFKFSTSKTVVMHFCRVRGVYPDPDLYINGIRIPCVPSTKFLGLTFDSKMTWLPHIKDLKARCLKSLDLLKVLSHTTWGADRTQMLRLYKSLIFSKLTYGCEVYTSATSNRLKMLNSIHHAGIRISTGAFRTSPIESLLVDAGEFPLEYHFRELLIRSWLRFQRLPRSLAAIATRSDRYNIYYANHPRMPHPFSYRIKSLREQAGLNDARIMPFKYSVIPPWRLPYITFCNYCVKSKKDLPDYSLRATFLSHLSEHDESVCIYTDGSKSDAGVGFGAFFTDDQISGRLPDATSIFTAELLAILESIKKLLLNGSEDKITIFCDSRSVLESLQCFNPLHPLVIEILEWLVLARRRDIDVGFCWVPAHVGIHGNEEADLLAKRAVERQPRIYPLPYRDYMPIIRTSVKRLWQEHWNTLGPNKMREVTHNINPWQYLAMPRKWEVILCRLRIGHTRLTHSYLMTGDHQPFCEDCLVPLTVRHLLVECPSLGELRNNFFTGSTDQTGPGLRSILGKDCIIQNILAFIEEAGFLQEI